MTRLALATAVVLSLLGPSGGASAWCRMTTSERMPTASMPCVMLDPTADPPEHYLAWMRSCTAIALSSAAPSTDLSPAQVSQILHSSIATWEAVTCGGSALGVQINILGQESTCTHPLYRDHGGNVNTIMFVGDWTDRMYAPDAFAVTTVFHRRSTGEILDADMEVNQQNGPYGVCPSAGCPAGGMVDLQNVLTHELGHYLGLAHSQHPEATMYFSAARGETSKRTLAQDDIDGICNVYPPGSPGGECDFTPRGGLDLDCHHGGCSCTAVGAVPGSELPALLFMSALGVIVLRRRRNRRRPTRRG